MMSPPGDADFRLGLVAEHADSARVGELLVAAARLCGRQLSCERLGPTGSQEQFDALFDRARAQGFDGLCIGGPFQEQAFARAPMRDADGQLNGSVNTVVFGADGAAHGFNTDQSAFVSVFCEAVGLRGPGTTCLVGAGSVGRAIAFGLLSLGIRRLRLADVDEGRAQRLGEALRQASPRLELVIGTDPLALIDAQVEGLVNATPVGSAAMPGSVLPAALFAGRRWVLDAVHQPAATVMLRDAQAAGVGTISGAEMFLHQGAQAFRRFTGLEVPLGELRSRLATG